MTQLADDNFICGCTGGVLKVQWCETDGVTNDVTVQRGLLPTHTTLASLPVHSQDSLVNAALSCTTTRPMEIHQY